MKTKSLYILLFICLAYGTSAHSKIDLITEAISKDDANQTETIIEDLIASYLAIAAQKCKPNVAKMLIKNGVNVNATFSGSISHGLHLAISSDCTEVARILIENGADVNGKDEYGVSALDFTAIFGNDEIAELLIKNGADISNFIELRHIFGTALEWTQYKDKSRMVKILNEKV